MPKLPLDLGSDLVLKRLKRFPRGATPRKIAHGFQLTERQTKKFLSTLCREGHACKMPDGTYAITSRRTF
jgi:DNA-binding IclR family transcriptional regulator